MVLTLTLTLIQGDFRGLEDGTASQDESKTGILN